MNVFIFNWYCLVWVLIFFLKFLIFELNIDCGILILVNLIILVIIVLVNFFLVCFCLDVFKFVLIDVFNWLIVEIFLWLSDIIYLLFNFVNFLDLILCNIILNIVGLFVRFLVWYCFGKVIFILCDLLIFKFNIFFLKLGMNWLLLIFKLKFLVFLFLNVILFWNFLKLKIVVLLFFSVFFLGFKIVFWVNRLLMFLLIFFFVIFVFILVILIFL